MVAWGSKRHLGCVCWQVYMEDARLKIDKEKIFVTDEDIAEALGQIKSCSARSSP